MGSLQQNSVVLGQIARALLFILLSNESPATH